MSYMNRMLNVPDFGNMDVYLREAIEKYLKEHLVNDIILGTADKRKNFKRFCEGVEWRNGKLYCKARAGDEPKVIPTPQQVDECLLASHVGALGRHQKDKKMLVKALFNAGYGYPFGLGGLSALVDE